MGSRRSGELYEHLETLFQVGLVGGLSDAQLLERFVSSRDEAGEAAFRALVARHGPMVLRVCGSILNDPHAAEDAFQVTFLALARKAGSIRKHDSIGSWLHGTAIRVAIKARTAARRRLARESRATEATVSSSESHASIDVSDLSPILHEEIERLPAKYRSPIVLCYLEGMTQDQAAGVLGWPAGTVRGRLARARDLLRARLSRRGLTVSAGIAASGSQADAATAGLSAALVEATVRAAMSRSMAEGLSGTAALLLKAMLRDMARSRPIQLAAPLVLMALVTCGAATLIYQRGTNLSRARAPIPKIAPITRSTLTDLAGDPLPDGALARLGSTRFSPGTLIDRITYSPDGTILASVDHHGVLDLWNAANGLRRRPIAIDEKNGMRIGGIAFAPDGRLLAVHTLDGIVLYEPESGRQIRLLERQAQVRRLAFSPAGSMFAASFWEEPIALWDVATGRQIRSFDADSKEISDLAFTPDGKFIVSAQSMHDGPAFPGRKASGPEQSTLHVWDVATGKAARRISLGKIVIGEMALAPDGKTVALIRANDQFATNHGRKPDAPDSAGRAIPLWELATGREIRRFGGAAAMPSALAFTPDGTMLASGEQMIGSGAVTDTPRITALHLWEVATGREIRRWKVRAMGTSCLAFAPDGNTLAWVASQEHVIRLWDVAAGRESRPPSGHRAAIGDAAFSPDGNTLITVAEDRTLRFWDALTGVETRQIEGSDDRIWFAALSADGKTLATGGAFQPSRLWDVASGSELRQFSLPGENFVWCGDLSADGKTLATSDGNGVILWDAATGQRRAGKVKSPNQSGMVKALKFTPDGKSVATIGGDWIRLWDVATAAEAGRFALPSKGPNDGFSTIGAQLVYSPDGKMLAASSQRDGLIFLLDASTGREIDRLDGPRSEFKALAFSPDGNILATAIDSGNRVPPRELAIRLWDVTACKELARVPAHRSFVRALAFSRDGRRLVSASEDATALVWDVARIIGRGAAATVPEGSIVGEN